MECIPIITDDMVTKLLTYQDLIPAIGKVLEDFSNKQVDQPVRQTTVVEKHEG